MASHQAETLPASLSRAVDFLRRARSREQGGWGMYPGLNSDLNVSAIVAQALARCPTDRAAHPVADAAAYFRQRVAPSRAELDLTELSSLYWLVSSDSNDDSEQREQLVAELGERLAAVAWEPASIPQRAALVELTADDAAFDRPHATAVASLLGAQRSADGSWPVLGDGDADPGATAVALRALSVVAPSDRSKLALRRGRSYLERVLVERDDDWDTPRLAAIVDALGSAPGGDYAQLLAAADRLLSRQNPADGGWALIAGRPVGDEQPASSTEVTAQALRALAATSVHQQVPRRLAETALDQTERGLNELRQDYEALKQSIRARVADDCGRVIAERDRLSAETRQLRRQLQRALLAAPDRSSPEAALAGWTARLQPVLSDNALVAALLGLASLPMLVTLAVAQGVVPPSAIAGTTAGAWLAILTLTFRSRRRARLRVKPGEAGSELDILADAFARVTEPLSEVLRGDLAHRLFDELEELPDDVAVRRLKNWLEPIGNISPQQRHEIVAWANTVLELADDERRVLFKTIRRRA